MLAVMSRGEGRCYSIRASQVFSTVPGNFRCVSLFQTIQQLQFVIHGYARGEKLRDNACIRKKEKDKERMLLQIIFFQEKRCIMEKKESENVMVAGKFSSRKIISD